MIDLLRRNQERRFREALNRLPQRGEGLHSALLGVCNMGVAAGIKEDVLIETISALDREFKENEIEEAVAKALDDATQATNLKAKLKMPAPVKKAAKAGKLLLDDPERTARLQASLIEAGGGEVDPFGPDLRAASNPPPDLIPAIPGMEGSECLGGLFTFLRVAFRADDNIYIGTGREGKHRQRSHIKTRENWLDFFSTILDRVKHASSQAEQQQILIALGYDYPLFCVNPLTGEPNEKNSFRSDDNVKEYRYVLLESDKLPLGQQVALIRGLELPVVAMTFSGNQSIHVLVRVDALPGVGLIKDKSDWDRAIKNGIFPQLVPLGFDPATKNPARLGRMPGLRRPDKDEFQRLLYLNKLINNTKGDSNV